MKKYELIALLNKDLKDEHAAIIRYLVHGWLEGEDTPLGASLLSRSREEMWHMHWLGMIIGQLGGEPDLTPAPYPYDPTNRATIFKSYVEYEEKLVPHYNAEANKVDDPHIKRIRVLEKGGATIILDAPAVSGDSLMGKVTLWTPAKGATVGVAYIAGTNLSISLAAVDEVAVRKPNSTATIGLAVGIIGVIVAISAAATSSALSRGFGCFTCDNSWP